mgnify:CR=1 FL=1
MAPSSDRRGLYFALAAIVVFGVFVGVVRFGAPLVAAYLYPTDGADLLASIPTPQVLARSESNELASAREIAVTIPASDEGAIPAEGKFISADLVEMTLTLYEDGLMVKSYPVLGKGKPGSHWETPTGRYSINYKSADHFSSIGKVHMPYSMHFDGTCFVQGWPDYPDGTPVPEGYSGGCIRLSTEDAAEIYAFSEVDTPLFVFEAKRRATAEALPPLAVDTADKPTTRARSYFVADVESGDILLSKNARRRYPIASVTKLMTAVVANETIAYDRTISVNGDRYVLGDLYYPLFLRSNNVVAETIAAELGRKRFLSEMNAKAKALEMYNTNFADASGLSEDSSSTAWDLFYLSRYLFEKKQFLLGISRTEQKTITGENGRRWEMESNNQFVDDPLFVGGKLGYTEEALQTSMGIFTVPIDGTLRTIAVIILGSPDWKRDTIEILEWLPKHVEEI